MLQRINTVTITAYSIAECERAYCEYFSYQLVSRGTVTSDMAVAWKAPAMVGNEYILLTPTSATPIFILFVQASVQLSYQPMSTYVWNAVEILVAEVNTLAIDLVPSPFQIVGPPANLSFSDDIRAMQVIGPAQELLYLTEVKAPIAGFELPVTDFYVDYPFIVILGARSLSGSKTFYQDTFNMPESPDSEVRISVLSSAFGLPRDTLHRITAMPLQRQSYIEIDECPPQAAEREQLAGQLPPGVAMVSFEVEDLEQVNVEPGTASLVSEALPYSGRRAVTLTGPANELIELLEA